MEPAPPLYNLPEKSEGMSLRPILLGILALVLLLAAGTLVWKFSTGADSMRASEIAAILDGTRIIEGPLEIRGVYEFDGKDLRAVPLPASDFLVSYARSASAEVALMAQGSSTMKIVLLGSSRTLLSDERIKSTLSISADGTTVAYAELMQSGQGPAPQTQEEFYQPQRWEVRTLDRAAGTVTPRGRGYAPHFFQKDGVSYLAFTGTDGTHLHPLSAGSTDLVLPGTTNGLRPTVVSPDGSYVALFDPEKNSYRINRLAISTAGASVMPVRDVSDVLLQVAFSGTHVIAVAATPPLGTSFVPYLAIIDLASEEPPTVVYRDRQLLFATKILPRL